MKFLLLPAASLILLTFCNPGQNRQAGDTGMANEGSGGISSRDTVPSSTPAPAASGSGTESATPAGILSQMNVANTMEIQLARMAAKQASSPAVKRIANKLVTDHSKNRQQVEALAQKLNVSMTPALGGDVAAADSAAMPADLQGKTGAEFDRAFIQHQIQDHQSNIQKIQSQMLPAVQEPQLKAYLQKTLTDMQGHLSSLQQTERQMSS
jgi:putative membrane protein